MTGLWIKAASVCSFVNVCSDLKVDQELVSSGSQEDYVNITKK